ncbi:MAG: glycosyltransferase family 1 protein, partial [Candidatus Falkowbacteria bacterium]|nr:glycosyltransferase family 1 protein [Candidatus Falkowbacteria bacterium]
MLIGIDASRANKNQKTGTEWYSYYLIRWLAKLDNKNKYILYTDKPLAGGLLDLGTPQYLPGSGCWEKIEFDQNGWQTIKSPFNNFQAKILNWPFNFFWTQGRLSWEMIWHRPDLLFIPAHALPIIHPGCSVVTIHDIAFEKNSKFYQEDDINRESEDIHPLLNFMVRLLTLGRYRASTLDYLRWSTKYGLKHARRVITVSNYSKSDLLNFYQAESDKISVIYNGYNRFLYKKIGNQEKIRQVLEIYSISGPYILYLGRIENKKNIPRLIEAFSLVKQNNPQVKHKLVLAGKASYDYDDTNYAIQEFGLTDEVIMTGWVDENDLPYFYNGSSAFIFPSNYEGFGIPLLQAMACGIPIATSCCTAIPEVVGDAALLFNPLSVKSMAEAMEKIIVDESIRNKLIKAGNERIKQFSWQKCAAETLNLLQ